MSFSSMLPSREDCVKQDAHILIANPRSMQGFHIIEARRAVAVFVASAGPCGPSGFLFVYRFPIHFNPYNVISEFRAPRKAFDNQYIADFLYRLDWQT
jgi:hypothetical protein